MPRRDAPRDSAAAGSRSSDESSPPNGDPFDVDADQRAHDAEKDPLTRTGEVDLADEPSTTVGPAPVRAARPPTTRPSKGERPEEVLRDPSRRLVASEGAAPADATRAEVNPLLSPKPATANRLQPGRSLVATDAPLRPEPSRAMSKPARSLLDSLQPPVDGDEAEPATSLNAIPPLPKARDREDSGGTSTGATPTPVAPLVPRGRSDVPNPIGRSSTRGEVSVSEVSKTVGLASPRKGTRPMVAVTNVPLGVDGPKKETTAGTSARSGTRGEVPMARPPAPTPLAPPVEARPSTPPKRAATRIEDEVTGPDNLLPRPKPTRPTPDEESTSPIDRATGQPIIPVPATKSARVEKVATAPARLDGRPMLADQNTGQFRVEDLMPVPVGKPAKKVESKGADSRDADKKKGSGGGALEGLRKLAQKTGMHLLSNKGTGMRELIARTGMHRLSQIQSLTGLHRLGPARFGFQVVIAGVMLMLGLGLVIHVVFGADLPPEETLQFLYPYGFTGGVQPNGRLAPPASAVHFKFTGTVDCGSNLCDHFSVDGTDGLFHIEMTVTKRDDGSWALVGGGGPPTR